METRTGWAPVCGVWLLCALTLMSIRVWQGADLAADLRGLATTYSFETATETVNHQLAQTNNSTNQDSPTRVRTPGSPGSAVAVTGYTDELPQQEVAANGAIADARPIVDMKQGAGSLPVSSYNAIEWESERLPAVTSGPLPESTTAGVAESDFIMAISENVNDRVPVQNAAHRIKPDGSNGLVDTKEKRNLSQSALPETNPEAVQRPAKASRSSSKKGWAQPKPLITDLKSLYENAMTSSWARSTVQILESLQSLDGLADEDTEIVFKQLWHQLDQLEFLTIQVSTQPVRSADLAQGELANELRQIGYSLRRRLEIWPLVHQLAQRQVNRIGLVESHHVGQFLLASRTRLNTSGVEKGWAEYLKLDQAASVFNSLTPNDFAQKNAARSVLARLFSPSLSSEQKRYLQTAIDEQTVDILRVSATELVDLEKFVLRLEKLEWNSSGANQFYINDDYQSMLWSNDEGYQQLAAKLGIYYRNANFRVSVSEALLNRMIPKMPVMQEPYRDKIMGADVVGQNRISNQIRVSLIPDPNQISMKLETYGNVKSRTTATKSGIVVENEGTSKFRIIKRLAFGQQGIFAYRPETTSQIAQRVVGLRSNLDNIPPLGWVVRRIAQNKIEQQAPATKRYAQHQLETKAETKFNQEIDQKLNQLEQTLTNNLLHPLIALDLEPDPVQINTTNDRIQMRYRLAGRDQMASYTARPRANQSCLMSMQIHESALNNLVSRFELAGKTFTTEELIEYINLILGTEFVASGSGEKKKPAEFEFAPFDPVRIEFEEQQISISFNLKSFKIGKGKRWKNLNIRATYDPQVINGFNIGLTQGSEGLRVKGRRLNVGDKIAIGLICEILFPEQFQVAMMPQQLGQQLQVNALQATQFVVSNGWIGLSVDDAHRYTNPGVHQAQGNRPLFQRRRR